MIYLGCIADDFTGATDLAGILARSGFRVSLRIGVPEYPPRDLAPFEIIALKCRSSFKEESLKICKSALYWLKSAGCNHFFWKYCSTFDSTPKGNIGPVAQMMIKELNIKQTIYCPAFPQNKRTVFMGNLFVEEKPLNESSMKDHPLNPMTDSNLVRWLGLQVQEKVGLINHIDIAKGHLNIRHKMKILAEKNIKHVIVDAICDEDLEEIAKATFDMTLITGGSAISLTLPKLYQENDKLSPEITLFQPPRIDKGCIVLCGSCSIMTIKQVENYINKGVKSYKIDPLSIEKEGLDKVRHWLKSQDITEPKLIYATDIPTEIKKGQAELGIERSGLIIEKSFALLAKEAFQLGIRRFVIAGGETSGAVTEALEIEHLSIGKEIDPGVPWTYTKSNLNSSENIALALKSGNFGSEHFFSEALQILK